jgi:hypothetical protein
LKEIEMTYQTGLVACIKVAGQILRENHDEVLLPFGTEYSILIKNLKSRRVLVKVAVDGVDATEGTRLVIQPNSEVELERFIRNGNLAKGNRFKFIERTGEIEKHRGIKAEDGLVRVEYWTEKVERVEHVRTVRHDDYYPAPWPYYPPFPRPHYPPFPRPHYPPFPRPHYPRPYWEPWITYTINQPTSQYANAMSASLNNMGLMSKSLQSQGSQCANNMGGQGQNCASQVQERCCYVSQDSTPGITVPGSESRQAFVPMFSFETDPQSDVLILKLRGQVAGKSVVQPVTVKTKAICVTCGRKNEVGEKFCGGCGTAMELL